MRRARTALVIGGGIIGVTSAYALARDGWRVQIADKNQDVGLGASFQNGRQLSYSYCNALANPRLLGQLPGLLLGQDNAFRLAPRFDAAFAGWIAQFAKNCTPSAYRRNTRNCSILAEQSMQAMDRLLEQHDIQFEHRACGKLVLLRNANDMDAAGRTIAMRGGAGIGQTLLSWAEVLALEPSLEQVPSAMAGALYSEQDSTGDCHAFTAGLMEILKREYATDLLTEHDICNVSQCDTGARAHCANGAVIEADLIVIASGHQAGRLTKPLGINLPIEPMKGYSFTAPLGPKPPKIAVTDHCRRLVFTNTGERMLIAGIAELGRMNNQVDHARLATMIEAAQDALPDAADYTKADAGWTGMRPMTPNSNPIIGKAAPRIALNVGHGMLGWTLAMGSAERLANAVCEAV